jgi:hypothetical protein
MLINRLFTEIMAQSWLLWSQNGFSYLFPWKNFLKNLFLKLKPLNENMIAKKL